MFLRVKTNIFYSLIVCLILFLIAGEDLRSLIQLNSLLLGLIIPGIFLLMSMFALVDNDNRDLLIENSEQFFNAFENLGIGMAILDLAGRTISSNNALHKIFGYSRKEMINSNFKIIYDEESFKIANNYFQQLINGEIIECKFENQIIRKNGLIGWIKVTGSLVRDINGNAKYVNAIVEDITDKKFTQIALEDSEEKYSILLNEINIGAYLFDLNAKLLVVNPAALKIFGRSREEMFRDPFGSYFHPEDSDIIHKKFFEVANEKNENTSFECKFIHGSGNTIWTRCTCSLVRDKENKPKYVWGLVEDITDKKYSQLAIEDSEKKFSILLKDLYVGVFLFDLTGKMLYVNPAGLKIFEKTHKEMLEAEFGTFCYPEDYDLFTTSFNDLVKEFKEKTFFECRFIRNNGQAFWTHISGSLVRDREGNPKFVWGFAEDIDEIKKTQQELLQSSEELLAIYNNITDGLHIIDIDTRKFLIVNKVFCDMLGYTEEEMLQLTFYDIHPPHLIDHLNTQFLQHVSNKVASTTNIPFMRKNKEIIYIDINSSFVKYKGKDCLLSSARDVTERKLAEEVLRNYQIQLDQERKNLEIIVEKRTQELKTSLKEIEETNKRLQDASDHKSKFLSTMSHELRTPLNAVIGFTDLLKGQFFGELNHKQLEYVNLIRNSGSHLLDLINDLLDITKIDAGAIELQLQSFTFDDLVEEVVYLMTSQIKTKNILVKLKLPEDKINVIADKRKCKQIIMNLLSNACKFTPDKGSIEINLLKENSHLKMLIKDSGIGIAEDQINKIFSEFYQADKIRDANLGGTGIGLALSKRLVEIQGGQIGVMSKLNEGSTFWFTLPIKSIAFNKKTAEEIKEIPLPAIPRKRKILVVEDNNLNIAMLLDQLSIYEHNVAVAKNGKEALDLIYSHKPELILMDMLMPVMDGMEATKRILAIEEFSNVPIIAMTASTGEEARQRHLVAGCKEHIEKPFDSKELAHILVKYLS